MTSYWDWHTPNSLDPPLKAPDGGGVGILLEQPFLFSPRGLTSVSDYTPNSRNQSGSRGLTAGTALDVGYEDRSYHFATPPATIAGTTATMSRWISIFGTPHRMRSVSVFFRFKLTSVSGRTFLMGMNGGDDGSAAAAYGSNPTMSLWVNNGFLEVHYGGGSFAASVKVTDTLVPVAAGTTYCCEVGVTRNNAPDGEIRVYLEDSQVFDITGVDTQSTATTYIGKVFFAHFLYDGTTVSAGSGADMSGFVIRNASDTLSDADFFWEQNVTPHISASRVVAQGAYSDLAADVTALDENTFTESGDVISFAGGSVARQSWTSTASLPIAAAGGTVVGFIGRVVFSDGDTTNADFIRDYCEPFVRIGGVDYDTAETTNATYINNATILGAPAVIPYFTAASRIWLDNPATVAAWQPDELEGLEWGCRLFSGWSGVTPTWTGEQNAEAQQVAFAFGEILWTTPGVCGAPVVDAECPPPPQAGPCDILSDAWFVDAAKRYDGRDEDGSALTLSDIGNGTDSGDDVGISSDLLATFEATDVGRRIRLVIGGVGYDATITVVNGTRGIEATLLQDVPPAALDVATTYWGFPVNTMALPWLEGEDVNVLGDGIPRYAAAGVGTAPPTKYSVVGGVLTLDAYYIVIIAGLPRISDAELLDVDADGGAVFRDRRKLTGRVGLLFEFTRQFSIGQEASMAYAELAHYAVEPGMSNPLSLPTRTTVVNAPTRRDVPGRLLIRQYEPLPLSLLGVIHEVDIGGRGNV